MFTSTHTHFHFHFPRDPGHEEILRAIREQTEDLKMNLQEVIADNAIDTTALVEEVGNLIAIVNDIPARVQAAVAGAFADAGVSNETAIAALQAVDARVEEAVAAAKAAVAGVDVSPATATDTLSGGEGVDTVVGGAGEETLAGEVGVDLVSASETSDEPAVLPPSTQA